MKGNANPLLRVFFFLLSCLEVTIGVGWVYCLRLGIGLCEVGCAVPGENEEFLHLEMICVGTARRSGTSDPMHRLHPNTLPFTYGYIL